MGQAVYSALLLEHESSQKQWVQLYFNKLFARADIQPVGHSLPAPIINLKRLKGHITHSKCMHIT